MKNVMEACEALDKYLGEWYQMNKHRQLRQSELHDAKMEFVKQNPEYKFYDFDIYYGFIPKPESYQPMCMDGCCIERMTVRGTYAVPIDWYQTRTLALRESKSLKLMAELRR